MLETEPGMPVADSTPHKSAARGGGSYSVFQEPWWLDAVAPGQWSEVTVESGGKTVGRLPYVLENRKRRTYLKLPPLTQYLGPWIDPGEGKYVTQLTKQHEILEGLIDRLPPFDSFDQTFAPNITNWLPFHWKGFECSVRYTYRLEDLSDLDAIWVGVRENIRREIRKAEKRLVVRDDLGIDVFVETYGKTFSRQSMAVPFSRELVDRVQKACRDRGTAKTLFAVDAAGKVHSAVFFVWDDNTCFYLMSGSDPELRTSGATSLLVWEGIKIACEKSAAFDFEGSMIPGVERFMRSFGARQTTFFRIMKYGRRIQAEMSLKRAWRAIRGK